jgi:16S rRNA (guanine966-N2)-methyltransferase
VSSRARKKSRTAPSNEVRVIGGAWRSRRIRFAPRADLRPTPDRVRETLFNWLGQDLVGLACLDLFAGSGALGFEAASRGAKRVVMVERDARAYAALEENRAALGAVKVELVRADALEFVRRAGEAYDVVFLDPPYTVDCWSRLASLLPPLLAPGARVYCESRSPVAWPEGWSILKAGRAGQVAFELVTLDRT